MKIDWIQYSGPGPWCVFFVSESEDDENPPEVTVHCHTTQDGRKDYTLRLLEPGVYYFNFLFKYPGKYIFVFFENGIRKLITIISVVK